MSSALGRIVIVIPTYNEVDNLEWIVQRLRAAVPAADVLVVDDSSPDGTGQVADRLAADDPQVQVVHRSAKTGLGAAYLQGFEVALGRGYDVVGEMDADGSHQPEQLPRLLAALQDADLVLGSRWVPGGSVVNWPLSRQALSRGGNLYTRLLLGVPVRDVTGGFRLFRRSALEAIDLGTVRSVGYCFQADLAWRAVQAGLRVREVPIEFVERVRGESKMSPDVAVESLRRITVWGLRERSKQVRDVFSRRQPAGWRRGEPDEAQDHVGSARRPVRGGTAHRDLHPDPGRAGDRALVDDSAPGRGQHPRQLPGQARGWPGVAGAAARPSRTHRMPAKELADGALILIGGTLLLTPGFLSDVVGFFCILPFTRPVARRLLTEFITRKFLGGPSGGSRPRTQQRPGPDSVVQGEVVD